MNSYSEVIDRVDEIFDYRVNESLRSLGYLMSVGDTEVSKYDFRTTLTAELKRGTLTGMVKVSFELDKDQVIIFEHKRDTELFLVYLNDNLICVGGMR